MKKITLKSARALREFARTRIRTRWHMSLILGGVALTGVLSSKIMLWLGLDTVPLRLGLAFLIAYACFFVFIRIWLYVFTPDNAGARHRSNVDWSDAIPDGNIGLPGVGSGGSSGASGTFSGGGGSFGGGGAGGSWDDNPTAGVVPAALTDAGTAAGASDSSFKLPDLDIGDSKGAGAIVLLLALIVLLAAILGSAGYLIYQAPIILSEALFEFLLSSGLVVSMKKMKEHDWMGSVLRATWVPALIMFVLTIATGVAAMLVCPTANTLWNAFRQCVVD